MTHLLETYLYYPLHCMGKNLNDSVTCSTILKTSMYSGKFQDKVENPFKIQGKVQRQQCRKSLWWPNISFYHVSMMDFFRFYLLMPTIFLSQKETHFRVLGIWETASLNVYCLSFESWSALHVCVPKMHKIMKVIKLYLYFFKQDFKHWSWGDGSVNKLFNTQTWGPYWVWSPEHMFKK